MLASSRGVRFRYLVNTWQRLRLSCGRFGCTRAGFRRTGAVFGYTGAAFGCTGAVFGYTGAVFWCTGAVFGCTLDLAAQGLCLAARAQKESFRAAAVWAKPTGFAAPREGERWRVRLVAEPLRFRLPGGSPRPPRVIRGMTQNRARNQTPKKAENRSQRPPPGEPLGIQFRS